MLQTVLSGRYRLLERIGEGGMAFVYRAEDTLLSRIVAVKVLRDELAADPEFLARFRREAQAAAALTHPNIVNVYDVGEDTGRHYIVMEHVDGPTLKQVIQQRGALPLAEALDIGAQVCAAADVAHRRGIVHRDIKPQNILLAADGVVKVTDFGLAQPVAAGPAGEHGQETVLGTAHYLSPEQAQGQPATPASDIYAIGVVLYEMLTGRVPYDGATAEEIVQKHVGQAPVPPRQLNESLPAAVEAFIYKALAKQPDQRHATARELGNALTAYRALSDGQTMAVRPLQGPARPPETGPMPPAPARGAQSQPAAPAAPAAVRSAASAAAPTAAASLPRRPAPVPETRRTRSEGVDWMLALLVLITLSCVAGLAPLALTVRAALLPPAPTPVPTVTVPNLVGLPAADAEAKLKDLGLTMIREGERFDDKIPAGRVLAQTIPSGTGLPVGSGVGVVLSKGNERIEAPGVTGLPGSDAMNRLTVAGFVVVRQEAPSRTVPAGLVISQSPPALSQLPRGATVTVTVSIGNKIELPDLMGLPEDRAQDTVRSLGLTTTYVNYQRAQDIPKDERWRLDHVAPGSVLSQTPAPGTVVDPGTIVYLAVRSQ